MRSRRAAIASGLGIYLAVALSFYALNRLAFDDSGPYPLWYSGAEVMLSAIKAVIPGFAAGWLHRGRGLGSGALVGSIGALVEVLLLAALAGFLAFEVSGRLALACVYAVAGGGLTNALGGAAGESLSSGDAARTRR
jgi:hypothetical protein